MGVFLLGHDLTALAVFANGLYWRHTGVWAEDCLFGPCLIGFSLAMIFSFYIFDLYRPKIERRNITVFLEMLVALAFASFLFGVVRWVFAPLFAERASFGAVQHVLTLSAFALWATTVRAVFASWFRKHRRRIRWLFVGTPDYLQMLGSDLRYLPFPGQFVCLVDGASGASESVSEVTVHGTWSDLPQYLQEYWTGIVYAGAQGLPDSIAQTLMKARLEGQTVLDLADFYEHVWHKVPVFYLRNQWFALSQGFQLLHDPLGWRLKRLVDIFVASLLLIPALPLMLIGAVLIKIDSAGPIIFRQTRTGEGGRPFTILKFRTMVQDAEKNGAQWAQKNDARITKLGRFLRLTRIDELPQLFNVIRGDMSFVGPRPERPEFDRDLEVKIPFYNLRHLVKPGITGWAQVNYKYGASVDDAREKLQFDLYYLKHYSVWLDFQVVLRTIRVVLAAAGR